jgi:hypothetical protein
MIEFITLFLGLTWGPCPVEVAVNNQVAAVELRLDGEVVEVLHGEPWATEVDFGRALIPHELEATALDAHGYPLSEVYRTINFGRSAAEASLVLGIEKAGVSRNARVEWQTYDQSRPKRMRARFDDRRVPINRAGLITLPAYDPQDAHLLQTKLTFENTLVAEAELSFGGAYSAQISTELTAVSVVFPAGTKPPKNSQMADWFTARGRPIAVFSAEQPTGAVFLVRDYNLPSPLPQISTNRATSGFLEIPKRGFSQDSVLFVATSAQIVKRGDAKPTAIFLTQAVESNLSRKGLLTVAQYVAPNERQKRPQQLFEALAIAGKAAAASRRPRAVLLLHDPRSPDHSQLAAGQTLGYLESLRVPLFMWTSEKVKARASSFDSTQLEGLANDDLKAVVEEIQQSLRSQHILWFPGQILPHQLKITGAAPAGVRFAL